MRLSSILKLAQHCNSAWQQRDAVGHAVQWHDAVVRQQCLRQFVCQKPHGGNESDVRGVCSLWFQRHVLRGLLTRSVLVFLSARIASLSKRAAWECELAHTHQDEVTSMWLV